ncbi:MAG: carbohydrate binding family 9 domain-containing protein, partial [Flavisolibacter sp.]|nr:carbohydrate binding family 9 domain-containing protein [Flavisolibacter sp.]
MRLLSSFLLMLFYLNVTAQPTPKQLPAKRVNSPIKIDGVIDEPAWKEAIPATHFVEFRPNPGVPEDSTNRTVVYLLYDNTSVYVGGYCYERTKDSISRELIGRDKIGVSDFVGVVLDTYYDKINGVGFYVTPYGEQYDAKYTPDREDDSWNAVWDSEAKIHADGWSFEMRIPYSALRFANRENQTWGLNITRRRNKTGQQYMWNPIDVKINGFINQEGAWTGIEKIEAPLRLSLSPYFSTYLNHYPYKTAGIKDLTANVNGGMDVKYGINEAFTLDMTLIPDFGQVQSDNQVLNLTPFEVKFNEYRTFFTEGTELFNKGDLFYSRRIGSTPIHYSDVYVQIGPNER